MNGQGGRAAFAVAYFALYWVYLWIHPEGELLHWITLVAAPLAVILWSRRRADPGASARSVTRELGLHWPNDGKGLRLALLLVVLVQAFQLMNRHQRAALTEGLDPISALWIVPTAFLLMILTAAFTEEFFFRGIFQRSIAGWTQSQFWAVVAATLAFSLYHVPYAYLNPAWPSSGDLGEAVRLAAINGVLGGVILGTVFVRSQGSLVPCVLVHAAIDWIPAIRFVASAGS